MEGEENILKLFIEDSNLKRAIIGEVCENEHYPKRTYLKAYPSVETTNDLEDAIAHAVRLEGDLSYYQTLCDKIISSGVNEIELYGAELLAIELNRVFHVIKKAG